MSNNRGTHTWVSAPDCDNIPYTLWSVVINNTLPRSITSSRRKQQARAWTIVDANKHFQGHGRPFRYDLGTPVAEPKVDVLKKAAIIWPIPCEAMFAYVAEHDPANLGRLIETTPMSVGLRARAARAAGRITESRLAVPLLLSLLRNPQPMVQEGALHGLSSHMTDEARHEIQKLAEQDGVHEVIRDIARELLGVD